MTTYSLVLFSKHCIVLLWGTVICRVRGWSCCSKLIYCILLSYKVTLSLRHFWKHSTNYILYTGICLERANVKSLFCSSALQLTCTLLYCYCKYSWHALYCTVTVHTVDMHFTVLLLYIQLTCTLLYCYCTYSWHALYCTVIEHTFWVQQFIFTIKWNFKSYFL